jgi:hypothetical protein
VTAISLNIKAVSDVTASSMSDGAKALHFIGAQRCDVFATEHRKNLGAVRGLARGKRPNRHLDQKCEKSPQVDQGYDAERDERRQDSYAAFAFRRVSCCAKVEDRLCSERA